MFKIQLKVWGSHSNKLKVKGQAQEGEKSSVFARYLGAMRTVRLGSRCWDGESLRKQSLSYCQKLTSLGKGQAQQNLIESYIGSPHW